MKNTNQKFHEIDQEYYLRTFKRYPITLASGKGAKVWDVEGKEYIDAVAGIAVNSVGHCHPAVVEAIQKQAEKLIHISNFYLSEPQAHLSQKLAEISGLDRVFLTNSGAEAVEGALKIARKHAHSIGRGGNIISMHGCFHGRTLATIATGKKEMQNGFEPIPQGFIQVPFNDIDAVAAALNEEVAAVIVEPLQGEGGIIEAQPEYLQQLRQLCDENNTVLIFDEIQSGIGRTGKWFAKDHYGVQPDIMTLAKGLGGGVPIGAVLSTEAVSAAINFGDHGTTFGGNPLVCAASLAVLKVIEDENLLKAADEKGKWLRQQINSLNEPSIKKIKGLGLMLGIEFEFETKPLVAEMLSRGVLANSTAGNVLRLVPPLNIGYPELELLVSVLILSLNKLKENA
ncbi:MAG: acetylornithine transaminase [Bacteroidia bacterium]